MVEDFKCIVRSREESEQLQKALFKHGVRWVGDANDTRHIRHSDSHFIFVSNNKITYEDDMDSEIFFGHMNKEIIDVPAFIKQLEETAPKKPASDIVTVKQLIQKLLDEPMSDEIIVKDKNGNRVYGATIASKKVEVLGALFG